MNITDLIPAKYRTLAIILATLAIVGLVMGYLAWRDHDVKQDTLKTERTQVENTNLKTEAAATKKDIEVRTKQNEIIVQDITPADFADKLRTGSF